MNLDAQLVQPGDLLVVHPWTLHYSGGNPEDIWRIAVSVRIFGDDIRWDPRPDCVNLAGISFDEMVAGERPMGPLCPLVWSEDGRREGDAAQSPAAPASRLTDSLGEMRVVVRLGETQRAPAVSGHDG